MGDKSVVEVYVIKGFALAFTICNQENLLLTYI